MAKWNLKNAMMNERFKSAASFCRKQTKPAVELFAVSIHRSVLLLRRAQVDVPIHILGGETAVISFVGIGYDSRKLQPSMLMTDQASDFPTLPIPQQIPIKGQVCLIAYTPLLSETATDRYRC